MKILSLYIIIMLWAMPLTAMVVSPRHITRFELKLIVNNIAHGILGEIPHRGKSNKYFLGPFNFIFTKQESKDPSIDVSIKTEEHQCLSQLLNCPLLPGTTSSVSFSYKDSTYTAEITPFIR